MPNEDMIAYWNEVAGPRWVEQRPRLDAFMAPLTQVLVERIGFRPGQSVVDIGCGAGSLCLEAKQRIGQSGHVTGVDVSLPLVTEAKRRSLEAGVDISFIHGDAQTVKLPRADAVISRFGVMFFEDRQAGFENLRRALKPQGRLVFLCWQAPEENAWFWLPNRALEGLVELEPPLPSAPGPFALEDAAELEGLLRAAHYDEIHFEKCQALY